MSTSLETILERTKSFDTRTRTRTRTHVKDERNFAAKTEDTVTVNTNVSCTFRVTSVRDEA